MSYNVVLFPNTPADPWLARLPGGTAASAAPATTPTTTTVNAGTATPTTTSISPDGSFELPSIEVVVFAHLGEVNELVSRLELTVERELLDVMLANGIKTLWRLVSPATKKIGTTEELAKMFATLNGGRGLLVGAHTLYWTDALDSTLRVLLEHHRRQHWQGDVDLSATFREEEAKERKFEPASTARITVLTAEQRVEMFVTKLIGERTAENISAAQRLPKLPAAIVGAEVRAGGLVPCVPLALTVPVSLPVIEAGSKDDKRVVFKSMEVSMLGSDVEIWLTAYEADPRRVAGAQWTLVRKPRITVRFADMRVLNANGTRAVRHTLRSELDGVTLRLLRPLDACASVPAAAPAVAPPASVPRAPAAGVQATAAAAAAAMQRSVATERAKPTMLRVQAFHVAFRGKLDFAQAVSQNHVDDELSWSETNFSELHKALRCLCHADVESKRGGGGGGVSLPLASWLAYEAVDTAFRDMRQGNAMKRIGKYNGEQTLSNLRAFFGNLCKAGGGESDGMKGLLLFGPPGTGKTRLIVSLTALCGLTMIAPKMEPSTMTSSLVGDTEKIIRALVARARQLSWLPCCVAIDEIDALVPARTNSSAGYKVDTMSTLLSVFGGIEDPGNLFLFGSTNRKPAIDPAFLRRLEQQVHVGLPNPAARVEMLESMLPLLQSDANRALKAELVRLTTNCSGANLETMRRLVLSKLGERVLARGGAVPATEAQQLVTGDDMRDALRKVCQMQGIYFGDRTLPDLLDTSATATATAASAAAAAAAAATAAAAAAAAAAGAAAVAAATAAAAAVKAHTFNELVTYVAHSMLRQSTGRVCVTHAIGKSPKFFVEVERASGEYRVMMLLQRNVDWTQIVFPLELKGGKAEPKLEKTMDALWPAVGVELGCGYMQRVTAVTLSRALIFDESAAIQFIDELLAEAEMYERALIVFDVDRLCRLGVDMNASGIDGAKQQRFSVLWSRLMHHLFEVWRQKSCGVVYDESNSNNNNALGSGGKRQLCIALMVTHPYFREQLHTSASGQRVFGKLSGNVNSLAALMLSLNEDEDNNNASAAVAADEGGEVVVDCEKCGRKFRVDRNDDDSERCTYHEHRFTPAEPVALVLRDDAGRPLQLAANSRLEVQLPLAAHQTHEQRVLAINRWLSGATVRALTTAPPTNTNKADLLKTTWSCCGGTLNEAGCRHIAHPHKRKPVTQRH